MLVKVRASPVPAGRSTGHLSRQEAGEGWPLRGPGAQKEQVTKVFQAETSLVTLAQGCQLDGISFQSDKPRETHAWRAA